MEEQQTAMESLTNEVANSYQQELLKDNEGLNRTSQLNSVKNLQSLNSICSLMIQVIALRRWPLNQAQMVDISTLYALSANSPSSSHLETELERLACALEK